MSNKLCVYIVDDEEDYLTVMKKSLEQKNLEVATFSNGFDLFEALEEKVPRAIIIDLMMPVMSGHSLGNNLKTNYPDTQIIIVSGLDPEISQERKDFWGKDTPYFQKPVDVEALADYLNGLAE